VTAVHKGLSVPAGETAVTWSHPLLVRVVRGNGTVATVQPGPSGVVLG
jgi:hypothetical protein